MLGADVGGTAIGAGVVEVDGTVRWAEEVPTYGRGPGAVLETLLDLLTRVQARAAGAGLTLAGCGIGVPGLVDSAAGRLGADVQNIPELAGCPLAERVASRLGLATVIDNDVNALTLGESRFGVARGIRSFVLLALGTGVGGGIFLNGDLVRGAAGYGGELGHATVDFDGRPCFCGSRGCLKAYVAGPDIAAQAREALGEGPGSCLAALGPALDARAVFDAAAAGDALAARVVEQVCRALGAALGAIMNGLNPGMIVLTGGVAASLEAHLGDVRRWARAYAFAAAYQATTVTVVHRTKTTSIRGPAALFWHEAARRGHA